jgi:hypothetical protein
MALSCAVALLLEQLLEGGGAELGISSVLTELTSGVPFQ